MSSRKLIVNLILLMQLHWSPSVKGRRGREEGRREDGVRRRKTSHIQRLRKLTKHRPFLKALFKTVNQQSKSHSKRRAASAGRNNEGRFTNHIVISA